MGARRHQRLGGGLQAARAPVWLRGEVDRGVQWVPEGARGLVEVCRQLGLLSGCEGRWTAALSLSHQRSVLYKYVPRWD